MSATRIGRLARASAVSLILALTVARPISAASPARSCPDAFLLLDFYQFVAYSVSLGNPPEVYPDEPGSGWRRADRNGDGRLCIMDLPDNYGQLDGLAFNAVDNVANQ